MPDLKSQTTITNLRTAEFPARTGLINIAYAAILSSSFPPGPHNETADTWNRRMQHNDGFHFLIAHKLTVEKLQADDMIAVALLEIFPISNVGLLTYVSTKPAYRLQGWARRLVGYVQTLLPANAILLAECERDNCTALEALGFGMLPVTYHQPPLEGHTEWVTDLTLCALHRRDIPIERLQTFQSELAVSLGVFVDPAHVMKEKVRHAASRWRRLPSWVMDVNERRVYAVGRQPSLLNFRFPWSHLMSVRMANEIGLLP